MLIYNTRCLFLMALAGILLSACHHNAPAPQVTPVTVNKSTSYTAETTDTSDVFVDKSAKDGLNVIKYKSGVLKAKGYYSSGKKYGEWQSFYENGKLWSDEFFTQGVRDGKITVWYNNNQKMYEGQYTNGKPSGTWTYWDNKGRLLRTSDYNKKSPNVAL